MTALEPYSEPDAKSDATLFADPTLLAAMDIGSNSIRMSLVRLDLATGNWSVLSQHKETVRLGQGEFAAPGEYRQSLLSEDAIARGVLVLQKFAEIARGRGAGEIVAIATAALREAENRDEFTRRAASEAGVEVRVVPGIEEARLIYLGVASGVELGEKRGLFIDIGGGSTELIVGTQSEHLLLDSLKLGAIRVGNQFLSGVTGPVPVSLYAAMQQQVRVVSTHAVRKIRATGFDLAIASSGTAQNLASIAARRAGQDPASLRNYTLKTGDLREIAAMLCKLTLEERRRVPGLNPERADIILSGAAVLQTLAEDLGVDGLQVADRSLREGVIVDALLRRQGVSASDEAGVRRRSIETLMRVLPGEEAHARQVTRLTLRLFDQAKEAGLHPYGPAERELLEYAALVHDIGVFVSHTGHHRHSYYLIRHSELAGFTDEEIEIIANLAYFHRKSPPKKRHAHYQALARDDQQMVRPLAALLRLAEGLDRSHLGLVRDVSLKVVEQGTHRWLRLSLQSDSDPQLELWYVGSEKAAVEEAFGLPLEIIAAAAL
ncbi:MAG: Ppx/GppA family phosphatase [Cytophagales bacterium]|nr:Ppx/GppA family phosphatase [Armatimonadota bacterium]